MAIKRNRNARMVMNYTDKEKRRISARRKANGTDKPKETKSYRERCTVTRTRKPDYRGAFRGEIKWVSVLENLGSMNIEDETTGEIKRIPLRRRRYDITWEWNGNEWVWRGEYDAKI